MKNLFGSLDVQPSDIAYRAMEQVAGDELREYIHLDSQAMREIERYPDDTTALDLMDTPALEIINTINERKVQILRVIKKKAGDRGILVKENEDVLDMCKG